MNPEHVFQMFLRSDRCQNLTGGETSSKSVLETEEEVIVHFYIGGFGRFQVCQRQAKHAGKTEQNVDW